MIGKHGRSPELSLQLFGMNFNSIYKICAALMSKRNPGRHYLELSEGIKESTHCFLQKCGMDSGACTTSQRYDTGCERKKKDGCKGCILHSAFEI